MRERHLILAKNDDAQDDLIIYLRTPLAAVVADIGWDFDEADIMRADAIELAEAIKAQLPPGTYAALISILS